MALNLRSNMFKVTHYSPEEFPSTEYASLTAKLYEGKRPQHHCNEFLTNVISISDSSEILGMTSIYHNPSFSDLGFIGQFESIRDNKVMLELLTAAERIILDQGKRSVVGPMNGSTWHPYRFRIFPERPFFSEFIHKDYYLKAWCQHGFTSHQLYQSNLAVLDRSLCVPQSQDYYAKRNLTKRSFSLEKGDLTHIHRLCNNFFVNSPMFSHLSLDAFLELYGGLIPFLDSNLIDLVFDGEELVGLFFAIPDHYKEGRVVVKTLVRNPSQKYRGLAQAMTCDFYTNVLEMGYTEMIHAYIHTNNASANISNTFSGKSYQKYTLLSKDL